MTRSATAAATPPGHGAARAARWLAGALATAMAIAALGGSIVACGGSAAQKSAVPAPAAPASALPASASATVGPLASAGVRSSRYGYSLAVPTGWTATENPGAGGVHPGDPGVDTFTDGRGNTLYIVATPLAAGESAATWKSAIARHLEVDHHLSADGTVAIDVDGQPGRLTEYHLRFDPYVTHELVAEVVRGERGYAITLEGLGGRDAEDRALLDRLLAGFKFGG